VKKLSFLIFTALLLTATGSSAAAQHDDFASALSEAGQAKRDILVLVHGSDWCKPGEVFKKSVWNKLSSESSLSGIVMARVDELEAQNATQKALKEKNKDFKVTVWNIPALAYCDHAGRPIAVIEGIAGISAKKVIEFVEKSAEKRKQRDTFFSQAGSASGREKALALGKALDCMDFQVARAHYGNEIKQMRSADPQDTSGYLRKYEYNSNQLMEHRLWNLAGEKKFDEAVKLVNEQLASDKLETWQRQELTAMYTYIYDRWSNHKREYAAALEKIIALDANSDMAKGANNLLNMVKREEEIERMKKELSSIESSRNIDAYIRIGEKLAQTLKPGELHSEAGNRMPGGYTRPEGTLVSEQGFVTFSSLDSEWDVPWAHPLIGRDKIRGFFHSQKEQRPWAKMELKKETGLKSIIVVNRPSCPERQPPIKVSVSSDGNQWTEVFRSTENRALWSIDLNGRNISARYVKVENDDDKADFFHLTNILVFGE